MGGAAEQLAVRVKAAADAADELAACVKPAAAAAEQLAARVKAAEVAADQHLLPPRSLAARTPNERDDDLLAVAAATPAVPSVAPRSMQPSHRRASGRLPVVPLAALQAPSPGRTDPTPSPVPRVSLVPPTGRLDRPRQALHGASDARNQPTVAARRHGDAAPAHTVPPPGAASRRGFLRRLSKDLRSSKREVVLGLGIGLGLSFVLVRWGQEYLSQRTAPEPGTELSVESLAVNPARLAAKPVPAVQPAAPLPALRLSAVPGAPARAPTETATPGTPPSPTTAPRKEPAPVTHASLLGGQRVGRSSASQGSKNAKPASGTRPRSGTDLNGDLGAEDAVLQAPSDEPRDKAPLSPSQSAGLGLDLPL